MSFTDNEKKIIKLINMQDEMIELMRKQISIVDDKTNLIAKHITKK